MFSTSISRLARRSAGLKTLSTIVRRSVYSTVGEQLQKDTGIEAQKDAEIRNSRRHFLTTLAAFSDAQDKTLIILDWDDTIFPTTWLTVNRWNLSREQRKQLKRYAAIVQETLQKASSIGRVVIITNAKQGWVEKSCSDWMPSLLESIQDIPIVLAQSTYNIELRSMLQPDGSFLAVTFASFCAMPEPLMKEECAREGCTVEERLRDAYEQLPIIQKPGGTSDWKFNAFGRCCTSFLECLHREGYNLEDQFNPLTLMSVGDSRDEFVSLCLMNSILLQSRISLRTKAVKLLGKPSITELNDQHEQLQSYLVTLAGPGVSLGQFFRLSNASRSCSIKLDHVAEPPQLSQPSVAPWLKYVSQSTARASHQLVAAARTTRIRNLSLVGLPSAGGISFFLALANDLFVQRWFH